MNDSDKKVISLMMCMMMMTVIYTGRKYESEEEWL